MKFLKNLLLSFVFAGVMALGTTSANAACKVHLGDFDWDSANVHTAIASYILDKGYGCEVQVTKGSTTPIMAALFDQQIDIITEVWRDNLVQLIEDNLSKVTIIELGVNTPSSTQGFYVDKPTSDKYNLKHVDDMKSAEIAKLFADPEAPGKGRMTSCISGWTCYTINLVKHKVYGLDEFYTNFDPGSSGAQDAAIAGGFKKGKPVFTYYWTPTGLMGKVDLVQLKEPAYDLACWTEMMVVVEDIKANGPEVFKDTCVSAYVDMALTKSATTNLQTIQQTSQSLILSKSIQYQQLMLTNHLVSIWKQMVILKQLLKTSYRDLKHGQNGFLAMLQKKLKLRFNF